MQDKRLAVDKVLPFACKSSTGGLFDSQCGRESPMHIHPSRHPPDSQDPLISRGKHAVRIDSPVTTYVPP